MALAWTLLTLCSVTKRQPRDTLMTFLSEGYGRGPQYLILMWCRMEVHLPYSLKSAPLSPMRAHGEAFLGTWHKGGVLWVASGRHHSLRGKEVIESTVLEG